MAAVAIAPELGVRAACQVLGLSRATFYRYRPQPGGEPPQAVPVEQSKPSTQPRALTADERSQVLEVLMSERFCDLAPHQIYATLLDEGRYLCSIRTMYRILAEHGAVKERRDQLRHPAYRKPELIATCPNEVWSWDITKLLGPTKWTYFYLYTILDIFSRYAVGWMLAERESATLAKRLIEETIGKQQVPTGQLSVHSDRGPSMKSGLVAQMLADLGVTKSHSRPHVSNDNPFSEAQFKTMKYRPKFPARFGSFEDAHAFCREFFIWYNTEHRHTGIGLHTPESVHYGRALKEHDSRRGVLLAAYQAHPERFVRRPPEPPSLPEAVWINPPEQTDPKAEPNPGPAAGDATATAVSADADLLLTPTLHETLGGPMP
jgi:putative transposase